MKYEDIYKSLSDKQLSRVEKILSEGKSRYGRNYKYFKSIFPDFEDFKTFVKYVKYVNLDRKDIGVVDKEVSEDGLDIEADLDKFLHSKSYWYDVNEDKYVISLRSKSKPLVLSGVYWRSIKSSYSNWVGNGSSLNEICRKFEITRDTLKELLRVMGVTHDSSPFTEEEVLQSNESELVEHLIRSKEESVRLDFQRKEYMLMKKFYLTHKNHRQYAEAIGLLISENSGQGLSDKNIISYDVCKETQESIVLISPTDFHWGKYAGKHTGDEYNREIAERRLFESTDKLMSRILKKGKPEKIVVGLGGDGLHIDNIQKMTTRGTPQDVDGSPIEIIHGYIDICRRYVLYLRKFCEVDVYVVNGNHDFYSSIFLRASLVACFDGYAGIKVISDLGVRQSFLYGNSLITFIHGDDGSVKDYPAIIANEKSELWGKSKWRYIFTGHFHTERELPTFGGVMVHRMPSLAGTDDWHHSKGYSSRKCLIGYLIHKEEGLITKEISSI